MKLLPTSEQITRFQFLFRGNPDKHYARPESGNAQAVPKPITPDDIARHLRGEWPSLLSVPTDKAGISHFGVIDVDRHGDLAPVDWLALTRRVAELQLPLIVTKSTGGKGAWLLLFIKEPEGFPSSSVRQILASYAAQLGIPDSEIFPKQDRTDNYGSGVNLPCFGDQRPAFDHHGDQLDLDGFLCYAEKSAASGALLYAKLQLHRPNRTSKFRHASESQDDYPATTIYRAAEIFDDLLSQAAAALQGQRHDLLHRATWYAARATLAGVFDETSVKRRITAVAYAIFPPQELRMRFGALRRGWQAGLASGPLDLELYPEDIEALRAPMIADDNKFWCSFYGNTADFPSATEARKYMEQQLVAAGSRHVSRVLKASDIDDAVARELLLELQLQQLLENLSSESSK